ncbi:MAG: DUF177 domain-containing protein [Paludibacteraceae bacterium]|nr:DUF177 domain-containing protein [Paludibacteraceae bacterium]
MEATTCYSINLNNIRAKAQEFDYELDDDFFKLLEQDEIHGGEVKAKVLISPIGDKYHLQIDLKGKVIVTCDRCLDDMTEIVEAADEAVVEIGDGEDEEIIYVDENSGELDLKWLLYELIETNLPLVHSHQAGECNPQMEELLLSHLCTTEEPEE